MTTTDLLPVPTAAAAAAPKPHQLSLSIDVDAATAATTTAVTTVDETAVYRIQYQPTLRQLQHADSTALGRYSSLPTMRRGGIVLVLAGPGRQSLAYHLGLCLRLVEIGLLHQVGTIYADGLGVVLAALIVANWAALAEESKSRLGGGSTVVPSRLFVMKHQRTKSVRAIGKFTAFKRLVMDHIWEVVTNDAPDNWIAATTLKETRFTDTADGPCGLFAFVDPARDQPVMQLSPGCFEASYTLADLVASIFEHKHEHQNLAPRFSSIWHAVHSRALEAHGDGQQQLLVLASYACHPYRAKKPYVGALTPGLSPSAPREARVSLWQTARDRPRPHAVYLFEDSNHLIAPIQRDEADCVCGAGEHIHTPHELRTCSMALCGLLHIEVLTAFSGRGTKQQQQQRLSAETMWTPPPSPSAAAAAVAALRRTTTSSDELQQMEAVSPGSATSETKLVAAQQSPVAAAATTTAATAELVSTREHKWPRAPYLWTRKTHWHLESVLSRADGEPITAAEMGSLVNLGYARATAYATAATGSLHFGVQRAGTKIMNSTDPVFPVGLAHTVHMIQRIVDGGSDEELAPGTTPPLCIVDSVPPVVPSCWSRFKRALCRVFCCCCSCG